MGSEFFRSYVDNINRVHLIEMIEKHRRQSRGNTFRASLIVNPVTGLPYDERPNAVRRKPSRQS